MKKGGNQFDVVTIGSATQDVFIISKKLKKVHTSLFEGNYAECLAIGSKNDIENIDFSTGGGATNTAATFAKLGFQIACLAEIGNDFSGREVKKALRDLGVKDFTHIHSDQKTAYSVILATPGHDRSILTFRGASDYISVSHFPLSKIQTKWFYASSLHGNLAGFDTILTRAEAIGAKVAWNPGAKELEAGLSKLKPMLKKVHLLSLNREEAKVLTGAHSDDIHAQIKPLRGLAEYSCITDGANGAWLFNSEYIWYSKAHKVHVLNTTGAGDAFSSGLVAGLIKYDNPVQALQLAMINAHGVIQYIGAKVGIVSGWPSEHELDKIRVVEWN
ncbi:MAG: carbohydrate kinase family protein [bacterium]